MGDVIREFGSDTDGPAFLERELMGRVQSTQWCDWTGAIYTFREHLTHFSNVKCNIFLALELVQSARG